MNKRWQIKKHIIPNRKNTGIYDIVIRISPKRQKISPQNMFLKNILSLGCLL
nr:hypothetical protein [uncultured Clostridium sp.]